MYILCVVERKRHIFVHSVMASICQRSSPSFDIIVIDLLNGYMNVNTMIDHSHLTSTDELSTLLYR